MKVAGIVCWLVGHRHEYHEDGLGAAWSTCGRCDALTDSHSFHGGTPWTLPEQRRAVGSNGWTCHSCGDYRPDELISVYSTRVLLPETEVEMQTSVRYCNDRPLCRSRAVSIAAHREFKATTGSTARLGGMRADA